MKKRFQAKLGSAGRSGVVADVTMPFDIREVWGKARVPIKGTINGFPFRTTVCIMNGVQRFCVNAQMRAGAGAGPGDVVEIVVEPDTAPRTIAIPADLRKKLGAKLTAVLEGKSYTCKKEYVQWYSAAKMEETRLRRLAKMKAMLAAGKNFG